MSINTSSDFRDDDLLRGDNLDTITGFPVKGELLYEQGAYIGQWQVAKYPVRMLERKSKEINQVQSPLQYSAIVLSISESVTHPLPELVKGNRYRLCWENSLSSCPATGAGYTVRLVAQTPAHIREELFNKTYSAESGEITDNWQTSTEIIIPRMHYISAELIITGWGGCILSRIAVVCISKWEVALTSPDVLTLSAKEQGGWKQTEDWFFSVYGAENVRSHLSSSQSLFFSVNEQLFPPVDICAGKAVIPANTVLLPYSVTSPAFLALRVDSREAEPHSLPIALVAEKSERFIFTPAPSASLLTAPVKGFFNDGNPFNVQIEEQEDDHWQPRTGGKIKAELLDRNSNAPCFSGEADKYIFRGQMQGTHGVCLPLLQAGLHSGTFTLTLSDEAHPEISQNLTLQVKGINTFTPPEPAGVDSVSRSWTTEAGRWIVQAFLESGEPAAEQPVEFRLVSLHDINVKFNQTRQPALSGKTDKNGYVGIPPIDVPDDVGAFDVYVDAGSDNPTPAQAHIAVSITEKPTVAILKSIAWRPTMKLKKPESFSVQMTTIDNRLITSGVNVTFLISGDTSEAHFRHPVGDTGNPKFDTTALVPAILDRGYALVTCPPIECTRVGTFTLQAISSDGASDSRLITVTE
jgi:hypothetical protein